MNYSVPHAEYAACVPIAPNVPSWEGGAPTSFTVAPPLPAWFALDPFTGVLTGQPTGVMSAMQFVVTASNAQGSTAQTLELGVIAVAPTGLDYPELRDSLARGYATAELLPTFVTGSGSNFTILAGSLPVGLDLNANTGAINGTPTSMGETSFTLRAIDCLGAQTVANLVVSVGWPLPGSVFAVNGDLGTVSRLIPDRASGRLRHADYLPGRGTIPAVDIGFSPATDRAWMLLADGEILSYRLDSNTLLPTIQGPPTVVSSGTALDLATDPRGRAVYVLTSNGLIHSFEYGDLGLLTPLAPATTACGTDPIGMIVDPLGRFLCVASNTGSRLELFALDQSTGAPTFVLSRPAAQAPTDLEISADGHFVYVVDSANTNVRAFAVEVPPGTMSEIPGSPFSVSGSTNPRSIAADPARQRMYVADFATGVINTFVTQVSGALTLESVITVPAGIRDLVVDPSGGFVYAARSNGSVGMLRYDSALGTLHFIDLGEVGTQGLPTRLAIAPFGKIPTPRTEALYVTSTTNDSIAQLVVQPQNAQIAGILGTLMSTGDAPVGLAFHPSRELAFALNGNPTATASAFRAYTHAATGLQPAATPTPVDRDGRWLGIEPLGRYLLYVSGSDALARLKVLEISQADTSLTPSSALAAGAAPGRAAIHPAGRWVFVPDASADTIRRYAYDPRTGALTYFGSTPSILQDPIAVAFHPDGIHVYCLSSYSEQISMFWFEPATGALHGFSTVPVVTPDTPTDIAITPNGRHLYVGHSGIAEIHRFDIDLDPTNLIEDGSLHDVPSVTATSGPLRRIAIDASGRSLFAVSTDGRVHGFRIQSGGGLEHQTATVTSVSGIAPITLLTRWR